MMGAVGTGLAALAMTRGASVGDALLAGLLAAMVVFATWALGRDLAPDDNAGAFVALLPAAFVVAMGTTPLVLGPLVVLGLVRVVNRSVGPPAMLADRVVLCGLVLLVAQDDHGWTVGVAAVLAFTLDGVLSERSRLGLPFAGVAAVAVLVGVLTGAPRFALRPPGTWSIAAMVLAALLVAVIVTQPAPSSECDTHPHTPLRRDRIQGGMLVALVAALGSLVGGDVTVRAWAVLWAACLGVVITRPVHLRLRG